MYSDKVFIFVVMKSKKQQECNLRSKNVNISLNEKEYALVEAYMKKYGIENRSRWLREIIITHVLKSLDKDYPTLFGENEMRR